MSKSAEKKHNEKYLHCTTNQVPCKIEIWAMKDNMYACYISEKEA